MMINRLSDFVRFSNCELCVAGSGLTGPNEMPLSSGMGQTEPWF